MRKLNTILSVLLLFICLLHGLMGSFMLLGISSGAGKFLAWIGVGILAAHTVLGLLLTAQTFRASRSGGKLYGKQNALFWARRTSGLAILLMLFFHIGVFGRVQDGVYILFPFTTVRLLTQLLLVASVFVHLLLNLRPLLVSLGIVRDKEQRGDLYLILSILVLFAAGSIILYYIISGGTMYETHFGDRGCRAGRAFRCFDCCEKRLDGKAGVLPCLRAGAVCYGRGRNQCSLEYQGRGG